jgi:hypothetical protein
MLLVVADGAPHADAGLLDEVVVGQAWRVEAAAARCALGETFAVGGELARRAERVVALGEREPGHGPVLAAGWPAAIHTRCSAARALA